MAASPTGSAMAFYFRNENRLQIASGLPASPEVGPGIDLAGIPGLLSSLAVSDDGRAALVAVADGGTGAVYLVTSEQKRIIAQAGDVRAMTFLTNSLSAVIADTTANEVRLLDDVMGAAATQILAEESRGISHPLALQVSTDNSRVFILNSGAQAITIVDRATGLLSHLPTNGSASRLQRLGGDVFQLTDDLRQSTLLFDATSPEPRIVFVPTGGLREVHHPFCFSRSSTRRHVGLCLFIDDGGVALLIPFCKAGGRRYSSICDSVTVSGNSSRGVIIGRCWRNLSRRFYFLEEDSLLPGFGRKITKTAQRFPASSSLGLRRPGTRVGRWIGDLTLHQPDKKQSTAAGSCRLASDGWKRSTARRKPRVHERPKQNRSARQSATAKEQAESQKGSG